MEMIDVIFFAPRAAREKAIRIYWCSNEKRKLGVLNPYDFKNGCQYSIPKELYDYYTEMDNHDWFFATEGTEWNNIDTGKVSTLVKEDGKLVWK